MIVCLHAVNERGALPLNTTSKCAPIFYSSVNHLLQAHNHDIHVACCRVPSRFTAVDVITATVNPIIIFVFLFFELIIVLRLARFRSGVKAVAT